MQSSVKQQHNQSHQTTVVADENTFTYLPKRSEAIGLSASIMNRVSSKDLKSYRRFGLFLSDLDPVAFTPVVDPRPRVCYNCWRSDHLMLNCPEPLTDVFCCNCGRRHVKIDKCPRCARVFWDLDESARQWLISYIPDLSHEKVKECSEKEWADYKDDMCESYSGQSDSGKLRLRKDDFKRQHLNKQENSSALILRASDKNESDNDEWWDCGENKDESVELHSNAMTGKEKVELKNHKSLPVDDRISYYGENLQAVNLQAENLFENQLNSLGESSSLTTASNEDDEDYDNIIVDEEEQIEESCVVGDTVRDFLDLLKAAKYLPLQQQNAIVLRFASECKKKL